MTQQIKPEMKDVVERIANEGGELDLFLGLYDLFSLITKWEEEPNSSEKSSLIKSLEIRGYKDAEIEEQYITAESGTISDVIYMMQGNETYPNEIPKFIIDKIVRLAIDSSSFVVFSDNSDKSIALKLNRPTIN